VAVSELTTMPTPAPPAPASLRANFAWTFLGSLVYTGCQWGMLVVLAKLGSPEMVGQFALGLAVAAPVMMFTNLQLRSVQATDARREYRFGDYLGLRLMMTLLAVAVIAGIALLSGYGPETAWVVIGVGLAKACESVSDVYYGLLQQHERMDRISLSSLLKGTSSLAVLGVVVYLTRSILWGTVGLAVTWALVLVAFDARNAGLVLGESGRGELRPRWDMGVLTRLLRLALPLGVVMCIISLNANIPRYFVDRTLGLRELGIFSALGYLVVAGGRVIAALGESASPRLAKHYAAGRVGEFRSLLLRLVAFGGLLGVVAVLVAAAAGREILSLLYRPEYGEAADVFLWLMVAAGLGFMASFLGYGMTAARFFRVQAPLFVVVGLVTAAGCFLLVPEYQLLGAAWAMVLAAAVQLLGSVAVIIYALRGGRGIGFQPVHQPDRLETYPTNTSGPAAGGRP
jgi:O-antigen/teichoic acid export membrane protein